MLRLLSVVAMLLLSHNLQAQPSTQAGKPAKDQQAKLEKPKTFDNMTPEEKAKAEADAGRVAAAGGMGLLLIGLIVLASLFFTFIPGMIATARGHQSQLAIWLVCFLLGWTGIGWIVALIWSFAATGGNNTTVIVERERSRGRSRNDDYDDEDDDRPRRRSR